MACWTRAAQYARDQARLAASVCSAIGAEMHWDYASAMSFEVSSTVNVGPEAAFDAMADARNETKWNSKVTRSDLVGNEPISQGSTFQTVNRGQTYDATITDYQRPTRLTFEVTGRQMDITTTFVFRAEGGATILDGSFDFRPKGLLKVVFPLMRPMIKGDLPKQMASFADFVAG